MVEAVGECQGVIGVDCGEHADTELVAPELAVAVCIDDAVGSEHVTDCVGADRIIEVDRGDDVASLRLDLNEG